VPKTLFDGVRGRARRAKTDRLDAEGLLRLLGAYVGGDQRVCSMVRVPTPEEEDAKRPHREREYLVQERTRLENRILALLAKRSVLGLYGAMHVMSCLSACVGSP
jgi:transposase